MRLRGAESGALLHAAFAHSRHVDAGGEGAQRLVRADIGRRLFTADVLLTCRERQHVAGLAVDVLRLADDSAGELAGHGAGGRHEAEVRTAERDVQTERLTVADSNVCADLTRGGQQRAGDGVDAHDELCARSMGDFTERYGIFDLTEEVRLLDIETRGVVAERCLQSLRIGLAVLCRDDVQLRVGSEAVGLHDLDDLRIGGFGDVSDGALAVLAHRNGLRGGGCTVVVGRIRDVHAGQLADHGLEFKRALQNALADFRLVGGVAGDKLLTRGNGFDNGGDEVAVAACTAKDGLEDLVLLSKTGNLFAHFQLAQTFGQVQAVMQEHLLRHCRVEIVQRLDADLSQHLLSFRRSGRNIRAHITPPQLRRMLRMPRHRAVLRLPRRP